jgi:hypothetical protein
LRDSGDAVSGSDVDKFVGKEANLRRVGVP